MTKIENDLQYKATMERIEELLPLVSDATPLTDKNLVELELLSNLVADYDEAHFPIKTPSLAEVLKLKMYENNLTQTMLSEIIGVSTSRFSEYPHREKRTNTEGSSQHLCQTGYQSLHFARALIFKNMKCHVSTGKNVTFIFP